MKKNFLFRKYANFNYIINRRNCQLKVLNFLVQFICKRVCIFYNSLYLDIFQVTGSIQAKNCKMSVEEVENAVTQVFKGIKYKI